MPKKDKAARKAEPRAHEHVPTIITRAKVEAWALCGVKQDVMAQFLEISDVTLRNHYRVELDYGRDKIIGEIVDSVIAKAKSDRPDAINAAKLILERRGGKEWAANNISIEGDAKDGKLIVNIIRQGDD